MAESQVDNRLVNEAINTSEIDTEQQVNVDNETAVNNNIAEKEGETEVNSGEGKGDETSVNDNSAEKDGEQTKDELGKEEKEVNEETTDEKKGDEENQNVEEKNDPAKSESGGDVAGDLKATNDLEVKAPVEENDANQQSAEVQSTEQVQNESADATADNQVKDTEHVENQTENQNGAGNGETGESKPEISPESMPTKEETKEDEQPGIETNEQGDAAEDANENQESEKKVPELTQTPKEDEPENDAAGDKKDELEKDEGVIEGETQDVEQTNENLPLTEENLNRLEDEDAEDTTRIEQYLDRVQDTTVTEGDTATKLPKIGADNQMTANGDQNKKKGSRYHLSDPANVNPLYSTNTTHITQLPQHKKNGLDEDGTPTHLGGRLPPSVMKMSTVVLSARKRAAISKGPSIYYEPMRHRKVATWDECMNSRPPLKIDLEGPGPWTYSPRNKPLNETNSPHWSFGMRLHEKAGGGFKAWQKEWFHSPDNYTHRLRFDNKWPTPATYNINTLVGVRSQTKTAYPSFTIIGKRGKFAIAKPGSDKEPAPNAYDRDKADRLVMKTAPAYSHSFRHKGTTLWAKSELTPAPCNYNPLTEKMAYKPHNPAFTIRGLRGTKRHELGPHSTL
ncbi:uncharacterized protein LOC144441312 [Glandiceps talaboti]